jgi:hypothetical protein
MPSPLQQDDALKQRIHSRLALSIVGLSPVTTSGSAGAQTDPSALTSTRGSGLYGRPVLDVTKSTVVGWLVPVFVAGALAGVAADRWYVAKHATVTTPARAVESVSTEKLPTNVTHAAPPPSWQSQKTPVEEPSPVRDIPPEAKTGASSAATAAPVDSLTTEREILDAARTALARGEPQNGIAALQSHIKLFPRGTLAEEREALYVRILVAMGDDGSARARAARFQQRFPNSIFMPVIERALLTISRRNTDGAPKP